MNTDLLPSMTKEDREVIERLASFDRDKVKFWTQQKEKAEKELKYWQNAAESSGALSIRITLQS